MASMNRAAALRKCLDKLDELDEALFNADASIGRVFDLREALDARPGRRKAAADEADAIEAFFDILEKKLNDDLKEEEGSEMEPFRNPRRRR